MKNVITVVMCFTFFALHAQTVTVSKQQGRVRGENLEGYTSELEAGREEVNPAWNKFLKDLGKVKTDGDLFSVSEPVIDGVPYKKGIVYAYATGSLEKSKVWIGLKESEWEVNDIQIVYSELEKIAYRFGVKFYRDKIQVQIDEAQRASDAVEKQKQRLLNQNKDLVVKLSNNEQEKIRLEKALEANKLEHEVLLVKIQKNKLAQDSVAQAGVKIKSIGELHKERQRKVN